VCFVRARLARPLLVAGGAVAVLGGAALAVAGVCPRPAWPVFAGLAVAGLCRALWLRLPAPPVAPWRGALPPAPPLFVPARSPAGVPLWASDCGLLVRLPSCAAWPLPPPRRRRVRSRFAGPRFAVAPGAPPPVSGLAGVRVRAAARP